MLAENVECSVLESMEKELVITATGDSDTMYVTTYKETVVRSLLEHANAILIDVILVDGRKLMPIGVGVTDDDFGEVRGGEMTVGGVKCELPLGHLTIKGSPRNDDHFSTIVNTPEDVESIEGAFE